MSDYLAPTPEVIPTLCPICEIERDPDAFVARFCSLHGTEPIGSADAEVPGDRAYVGNTEAGGEDNAAWCDLFHRKKIHLRPPR